MLLPAAAFAQLPVGWSRWTNSPGVETIRHDDIYFTDPNALSLTNGSFLLTDSWINSSRRFYQVVEH